MAKNEYADIINAQGTSILTAKKIHVRDNKIVMDGNIMGSMPGQFYVTPLNLYKMSKMIDGSVIVSALKMIKQGKKEFKAQQQDKAAKGAKE